MEKCFVQDQSIETELDSGREILINTNLITLDVEILVHTG